MISISSFYRKAWSRPVFFAAFFLTPFFSPWALGDEKLPPPATHSSCAYAKKLCAISDIKSGTSIFRIDEKRQLRRLWKIPGWFRYVYLSKDGSYVLLTDFDSLLPLKYSLDMEMFQVWKGDKFKFRVYLHQLVKDKNALMRTESHFYWGDFLGFDGRYFLIKTVEKKRIRIDMDTGAVTISPRG